MCMGIVHKKGFWNPSLTLHFHQAPVPQPDSYEVGDSWKGSSMDQNMSSESVVWQCGWTKVRALCCQKDRSLAASLALPLPLIWNCLARQKNYGMMLRNTTEEDVLEHHIHDTEQRWPKETATQDCTGFAQALGYLWKLWTLDGISSLCTSTNVRFQARFYLSGWQSHSVGQTKLKDKLFTCKFGLQQVCSLGYFLYHLWIKFIK